MNGKKAIIIGLVAGVVLGFGGAQFRQIALTKKYEKKLKQLTQRSEQLQRQLADASTRTAAPDSASLALRTELETVRKEKEQEIRARKKLVDELKARQERQAGLEKALKEQTDKSDRLVAQHAELEKRINLTTGMLKEREKELKAMTVARQEARKESDVYKGALGRSEENNARLAGIAKELLKKYEGKGVLSAIMQKEPLTQVKKVELDKIVRDYDERIEQNKTAK